MASIVDLRRVLKDVWGYNDFRPLQLEAVQATLAKKDVLLLLPTSGGKSLAFQLPPLMAQYAVTVIICPLIALAKDQVERCLDQGIDTESWNNETTESKRCSIEEGLRSEEPFFKLLYTTPESLRQPRLLKALLEAKAAGTLQSFAVDESHCISEWGHDFRPAYVGLGKVRALFPEIPFIAVTGTATQEVQSSIVRILGLNNPVTLKQSFNRPNLKFLVRHKELLGDGSDQAVFQDLVNFIRERAERECGIIYCQLRKTCDDLTSRLLDAGIDVAAYHAGKEGWARSRVQRDWQEDGTQVICATIAFGMGIDKADVRWIVHYNTSKSIESYCQEAGRAGRDNNPSTCLLYCSQKEMEQLAKLEKASRAGAMKNMASYCNPCCRRKALLGFLGERRSCCGADEEACDFCQDPKSAFRAECQLEERRAALNFAARTQQSRLVRGSRQDDPGKDTDSQGLHSVAGNAQPAQVSEEGLQMDCAAEGSLKRKADSTADSLVVKRFSASTAEPGEAATGVHKQSRHPLGVALCDLRSVPNCQGVLAVQSGEASAVENSPQGMTEEPSCKRQKNAVGRCAPPVLHPLRRQVITGLAKACGGTRKPFKAPVKRKASHSGVKGT